MVGRVQSKQNRSKDYKTATGKDMIGRRRLLGSVGFSKGMFLTFYSFRTVFALFTISLSFFLPPKPRRGMVTKTTYVTDKGSIKEAVQLQTTFQGFLPHTTTHVLLAAILIQL